ncbi:hypothetical protein EJ419_06055 [Alloscardovia theropitheci]|uniref:Uncharacterized protein n=1 Tax=Alloscardovia theropitheci TaxID=2496842 RepID=A0A4R0QRJ4_9BIFI|nr:hypothetical protein [Alloscardovia theropitheci]TCD53988.1 hypothetical protein EJ419_06055 [Alloscardovia theropitheci]
MITPTSMVPVVYYALLNIALIIPWLVFTVFTHKWNEEAKKIYACIYVAVQFLFIAVSLVLMYA